MTRTPLVVLALAFAACPGPGDALRAAARPGLEAIRGESIAADGRNLADAEAAQYVARAFREIGLAPAGVDGTYLQPVPLRGSTLDRAASWVRWKTRDGASETLAQDEDVVIYPSPLAEHMRVGGPMTYVGFGVTDGELDADLDGGIGVVLEGAPAFHEHGRRWGSFEVIASDTVTKVERLAEAGAFGVIVVQTKERDPKDPRPDAPREQLDWLDGSHPGAGPPVPMVLLRRHAFDRMIAAAGKSFDDLWNEARSGRAVPFSLGGSASLLVTSTYRTLSSDNVAALLPGGDPARSREVVVYSARLGDAGGVAGILAIARGFAALRPRPPRSILFVAFTGEERDLVGSDYFAAHPTVPLERLVANIHIAGPMPVHEMVDVVARGMEHSSLAANVRAAAAAAGVAVAADPMPEELAFVRAGHISFVMSGVPAIFPGAGVRDAAGRGEPNLALRPAWLQKEARLNFLIGLSVAGDAARPHWNRGSPFAPVD